MASALEQNPLKVAIIVGATRPGRKADTVAGWVGGIAAGREEATFEIVDLADYALPHFDELMPPLYGHYANPHTLKWAEKIGSFDAFVFVTPEYNASIPAVLKNAIDYLAAEWNDKPAGFVGYGIEGGVRAVGHLRVILEDLKVTGVQPGVELTLPVDFEDFTVLKPSEGKDKQVRAMLDALLTEARRPKAEEAAA
ncbi:MAG: NADPH-dependent FMN reductase [Streptomyces sp.]|uniref:NADPH-dependent FMN reductase n=1 Tax=Streptomyces sp. TaxID=1931 RepID=UPI003D6AF692